MESNVDKFVAVTGVKEEDARLLLEACAGNLDMAINVHMENQGQNSSPQLDAEGKSYEEIHGVRAPLPRTSGVLLDDVPSTSRSLRSRRLPPTVFDPFQDYSRVSQKNNNKLKTLSELFKPPFDLMFVGTFDELKVAGRNKQKWLLVNVQDSKQFSCQVLNRDVWSHEGVKTIISTHFLFWQVHSITDDGLRFKQLYHVEVCPFIAILDPRTGEKMCDLSDVTADKLISELTEFLHSNILESECKSDRGLAELTEEEQLAAAIKASLQDKTHSKDSDECISSEDEEEGEWGGGGEDCDMEDEPEANSLSLSHRSRTKPFGLSDFTTTEVSVISRKRKHSDNDYDFHGPTPSKKIPCTTADNCINKQEKECHLLDNHSKQNSPKQTNKKGKQAIQHKPIEEQLKFGQLHMSDISRILIRLPDGSRIQKMFHCNSPIEDLFSFLSQKGFDSSQHEMFTNFPRRSLNDLRQSLTFKEADLYPSVTIFVQD